MHINTDKYNVMNFDKSQNVLRNADSLNGIEIHCAKINQGRFFRVGDI